MAKQSGFERLSAEVRRFAVDRDWEQFHSPKNLSMALSVECAELMEHFQWLTEKQSCHLSSRVRREVSKELADVQIYLIRLSQMCGLDLVVAANRKLVENARKYPVGKARGRATKYTDLRRRPK